MTTLYDVDRDALAERLAGEPRYRVDQVWSGLYEQLQAPETISNLPKALRARLGEDLPPALDLIARSVSDKGDTVKYLWQLDGGARIETVLDALPRPSDGVHQQPGGMCDGLRILCHRTSRVHPPPLRR